MLRQSSPSSDTMQFDSFSDGDSNALENLPVINTPRCQSSVVQAWTETFDTVIHQTCQLRSPMSSNAYRQSILPVFPALNDSDEFYPLLTNIPHAQLSNEERQMRTSSVYQGSIVQKPVDAEDEIGYGIRNRINYYSKKWNVDKDILIMNLNRLLVILPRLALKSFTIRRQQQQQREKSYELSIQEWFIVLEIYLQLDVENFFMKTCTFRHSKPRSNQEGLFCINPPEARYGMQRCKDNSCRFCFEQVDLTNRIERAMHFSNNQVHHFVNNYRVYLNCDVTCTTSNLIYALTCPCHQYDYIGRCQVSFRDRMWHHRMTGCRILSNFFIGPIVADRLQHEREPNPIVNDSHIKLYEHSTQCPTVLEMFLKCQPTYWCFVPMTIEQVMIDDANITSVDRSILAKYQIHESIDVEEARWRHQRDATLVRWCVDNLPQPPANYQFSFRQRIEQYEFFQCQSDLFLTRFLDLYNVAIVFALHETCSDEMRHLVEALLVAHAEPKLNVMMSQNNDLSAESANCPDASWCEHLVHPRLHSSVVQRT